MASKIGPRQQEGQEAPEEVFHNNRMMMPRRLAPQEASEDSDIEEAIVIRNRRDPLYFIPQRRGRGITTRLVGVVDWYRQNELLYNKKMRAYRDRDKKTQTWNTKAAQLGVDGEFIKLISKLNLILIQN